MSWQMVRLLKYFLYHSVGFREFQEHNILQRTGLLTKAMSRNSLNPLRSIFQLFLSNC
jgi:hypothetical protein